MADPASRVVYFLGSLNLVYDLVMHERVVVLAIETRSTCACHRERRLVLGQEVLFRKTWHLIFSVLLCRELGSLIYVWPIL